MTPIPEQVWRMWFRADRKSQPSVLRGCAAWMSAGRPVQSIAGAS